MKVKTAYSDQKEIKMLIKDLKQQIGGFDTRFILFFASPAIDPEQISAGLQKEFTEIPIMGCTSSGEIVSGKMMDHGFVAMAFGPEIIGDCRIEVLEGLSQRTGQVEEAFKAFENYYDTPARSMAPDKYVGLMLTDGLCGQEERLNERIGDMTNVTFIGGSAGDDLAFKKTWVYANGKAYSDAAVLVLIRSNSKFDFLKTQSFVSTGKKVRVTKVDEAKRKVMEINSKPAAEGYAEILGVPREEVNKSFFSHPVGLVFGDDFFVRSPQRTEDDDIYFYCAIKEGMELEMLASADIVESTQRDLKQQLDKLGSASAILNFNCILRTLELKEKKQEQAYADLFKDIPTIGFSTYGESYIGHINQTSTMLLFD